jgi:hypothetical protein
MEARFSRAYGWRLALIATLFLAPSAPSISAAAGYRTKNFTVDAPTPQLAKEIGDTAEQCRRALANEWLGRELPPWTQPCPIKARVAPNLGAGGATSFVFDGGQVFGWRMEIQGSRERVLDSVVPHEVTHTIFATHFRQPLPRWADEGACTTVEHQSEIAKQERMLIDFLRAGPGRPSRGIPFSDMFAMKEYPRDVLPLYAQGHSLAKFLIGQRGKRAFLNFLADGMQDENWPRALRTHYGYDHLLALQNSWMDWIRAGRPEIHAPGGVMLASTQAPTPPAAPDGRSAVDAAKEQAVLGGPQHEAQVKQPSAPAATLSQQHVVAEPAAAASASNPAPRSVYGESATWRPAKATPAMPASTSADARSSAGPINYDAARPRDTAWR